MQEVFTIAYVTILKDLSRAQSAASDLFRSGGAEPRLGGMAQAVQSAGRGRFPAGLPEDQSRPAALEQRLSQIGRPDFSPEKQNGPAKELVERFLATAPTNREVLVSLIERAELTEEKEVVLHFRFRELEQKG